MPYQPPSAEDWQQFLTGELGASYVEQLRAQGKSDRIKQVEFITSFQSIVDVDQRMIALVGACIFIAEKINKEYRYTSPQKSAGLFQYCLGTGSELFTKMMEKGLKTSKDNVLDDKQKLIYLQKFYALVKAQSCNAEGELTADASQWLADINSVIALVIHRSQAEIGALMRKSPSPQALLHDFKHIPARYEAKSSAHSSGYFSHYFRVQSSERVQQLKFIEILGAQCKADDYELMYGYLLLCLHEIGSTRSDLYLECRRVANIEDETALDADIRHAYYAKLNAYVSSVLKEKKWDGWREQGLAQPAEFFAKMRATLDKINFEITHTATHAGDYLYVDSITSTVTTKAAQHCIGVACTPIAAVLAQKVMVGGGLSTVITVVRPDVAVAALLIASLVKDNLLSSLAKKISSMLNAFLLETAKAPIALGGYMLKMLTQFGYSFIAGHDSPKDLVQEVNEQEWVMTLLSLDDAVFPKANKDQIRRIVGMIPIVEVEESLLTESTPSTACASVPALGK